MKTYEKIYERLSKIYFWIHAFVFVLVFIASFLPFRKEAIFYQVFNHFPGQAFVILSILLAACLMAFLAIKRPWFSILVVPLSFAFFEMMLMPYALESFFIKVENIGVSDLPDALQMFGIGFRIMNLTSRVTAIETPFMVYAIIIAILRGRDKRTAKGKKK